MSRSFWMWNCNFVIIFICCNLVCCVVSSQTDWSVWLNILRINEWALRYMIVRTVCASITVRFVFMFISIFFHSKEEVYNLYAIFSTNLGEKYKKSNEKNETMHTHWPITASSSSSYRLKLKKFMDPVKVERKKTWICTRIHRSPHEIYI